MGKELKRLIEIKIDREKQGETMYKQMDMNGISTWKIVMKGETKRRVVGGRKIERGEEGDKEREL